LEGFLAFFDGRLDRVSSVDIGFSTVSFEATDSFVCGR